MSPRHKTNNKRNAAEKPAVSLSGKTWWVIFTFSVGVFLTIFAPIIQNRWNARANSKIVAKTEPVARQETATSRAAATIYAAATQSSIQATATQARTSQESNVNLAAYYFCSRQLDLDGVNMPQDLSEKLKGIGVSFGKIIKTPYWMSMHQVEDREYLFIALANRGEVYIDPQATTNIIWEPAEMAPADWLLEFTIQKDGRIEAKRANLLLVADRRLLSPTESTVPSLELLFLTPDDPALSLLPVCDYPKGWSATKIQFTLAYLPKDLPARQQDFILSAEDFVISIPQIVPP